MNNVMLSFKDTEKFISFDLDKNTLFYGNNGKGKTRVLKTIFSLYELAHQPSLNEALKLIEESHLKELKINQFNYIDLFTTTKTIKDKNEENFKKFLNSYELELLEIIDELRPLRNAFAHNSPNLDYKRHERLFILILDIFSKEMNVNELGYKIKKSPLDVFETSSDFEMLLEDLNVFLQEMIFENGSSNLYFNNYSTNSKSSRKYRHSLDYLYFNVNKLKSVYYVEVVKKTEIRSNDSKKMSQIQEQILKSLSSKRAQYITSDNLDINNTLNKINTEIDNLNSSLQKKFWKDNYNFERDYYVLINLKNSFVNKVNLFNETMDTYGGISIKHNFDSGISFYKNNEKIFFDKLSSGEKKISYIFLEMIFSNVDVLLIDEPELSMSLNYQNKLVKDLMKLTGYKKLFIATHAPFIYEDFKKFEGNIIKEVK